MNTDVYVEDDEDGFAYLDRDQENADWTKQTWDLPPYKSPAFLQMYPDLEKFRTLPIYNAAVKAGLIHDDEWVADHVQPSGGP